MASTSGGVQPAPAAPTPRIAPVSYWLAEAHVTISAWVTAAGRGARVVLALAALFLATAGHAGEEGATSGGPAAFLTGKLLIAAPTMADPRFRQTVILMVEHNAEGAFGLIVNKPMGEIDTARLYERLGLDSGQGVKTLTVFYGGPVQPEFSFVIHGADFASPDTRKVTDALFVSPESVVVAAMAQAVGPKRSVLAVGYSGWGPGQLESEMRRDDWVVAPPDTRVIFDSHYETKWQRAMELRYRAL